MVSNCFKEKFVNKAQASSENLKFFWVFILGRWMEYILFLTTKGYRTLGIEWECTRRKRKYNFQGQHVLPFFYFSFQYDTFTAKKLKLSIKDFFSKCDQICSFLWIWAHLLSISLIENFIFCAVFITKYDKHYYKMWLLFYYKM